MNNRIIIEGFWGMGKTAILNALERQFNYVTIIEPEHLRSDTPIESGSVNDWYVMQHDKNQQIFFAATSDRIAMERSIVSSMAYLYASGETVSEEAERVFARFKAWYTDNGALLIFIFSDADSVSIHARDVSDPAIVSRLSTAGFSEKYEEFYREILPSEHGIHPLCINIFDEAGERRSVNEIIDIIEGHAE